MSDTTVANPAQGLKVLTLTLMGAPILIAVALYFVLSGIEENIFAPSPLILVPIIGGLLVNFICMKTYGNLKPLDPNDPSSKTSIFDLQSNIILRFALIETLVLIPLMLAFVYPYGGYLTLLVGIVVAEYLFFTHVYTGSSAHLTRLETQLDSNGGRSNVRELLTP